MFGVCAFFAVVLTVVCDVVEKDKPTGLGFEAGGLVVDYLRRESGEDWDKLVYGIPSQNKAERYLRCTLGNSQGDDLSSGGSTGKCEELLEGATLLYGMWNGHVESSGEIVKKIDLWSSEGGEGGISFLETTIKGLKVKDKNNVGCAYYFVSSDVIYTTDDKDGQDTEIGDLMCIFE